MRRLFKKRETQDFLFLLVIAIEFLSISLYYARQASDTNRVFLWGYSIIKLTLILSLGLTSFALLSLSLKFLRNKPFRRYFQTFYQRSHTLIYPKFFFLFIGVSGWIVFFIPGEQYGQLKNYIEVARPLLVLAVLLSFQILGYLFLLDENENSFVDGLWRENKHQLLISVITFSTLGIGWGYLKISGLGFSASGEDWNETGVPVLGWQIFIAMLIGLLFLIIERVWHQNKLPLRKFDTLVFVSVWIVGGVFWASTPVPNGYLNPGPYPPTYETYPFADAARFDIMSQYALIGQGLNNGKAYNRPVYPIFLVYLHMLSGQNYDSNMGLQAALLAVFPALLYLITKFLSNRSSGVAIATVIILRGINGIAATNLINLSNQKQMLTGFPTALLVGLILLSTFIWLHKPNKLYLAVIMGGIFGLGIYLRQTFLGFSPVVILLPFLTRKLMKQRRFIALTLFIFGIITFGIPYEVKNYVEHPNYRYPAVIKKIFTVAETRYIPKQEPPTGRESSVSRESGYSWDVENTIPEGIPKFKAIGNHLARNIVTSTLTLPHSFSIDSLRNTIKAKNSFWRASWNGRLDFEQSFFLILNLALVSIGVVFANYRFPIAGWVPLLFFFGYNLANAFAKSSGGRYIVPVDWIIILYFVIGLFQLLMWIIPITGEIKSPPNAFIKDKHKAVEKKEIFLAFLSILVLGSFLILPDFIFPKKFKKIEFDDTTPLTSVLYTEEKQQYIKDLLLAENIVIIKGQIMYPRYYIKGDGELSYYYPYKTLNYPRLAFILIGPSGTHNAVMSGVHPRGPTNLSEAIIIGCKKNDKSEKYIDVRVVLITSEAEKAYFREPLQEPICKKRKP
ncbi:MAG: hypothetical protein GY755_20995 [Chloroflexi bacterium]|nr:hypothetical protein [Chloroflexota bacterium]